MSARKMNVEADKWWMNFKDTTDLGLELAPPNYPFSEGFTDKKEELAAFRYNLKKFSSDLTEATKEWMKEKIAQFEKEIKGENHE